MAFAMMPPKLELVSVPQTSSSLLRALAVGAFVLVAVAACGRKGPLEPPPGAVDAKPDLLSQEDEDGTPNSKTLVPSIAPVGSGRKGKPIKAPRDKFFLDPIL